MTGRASALGQSAPIHVWSYDFVANRIHDGRAFRMLCIIDEFTWESHAIHVAEARMTTRVAKKRLQSTLAAL